MKAAIITLHSVNNYGTQLQAYAAVHKLRQFYDDVVMVDYRRSDTYGLGLIRSFAKGNPIRALAFFPTYIFWLSRFGNFRRDYLPLSANAYLDGSDFTSLSPQADAFFVGSDQVWNTGWNHGVIKHFYLDFVADSKPKFSLSSSFGTHSISQPNIDESRPLLLRFDAISVREDSGQEILHDQYGIENSVRLVDPTLALPPSFWRKATKGQKTPKGEYILAYALNRSREFSDYARKLSFFTGLPVYRLCTRFDQAFDYGRSIFIPEILGFPKLIDNARFVLTDSFHATAFATNLNTDVLCYLPRAYSSRITDFLDLVGLSSRIVQNQEDFSALKGDTDFQSVNQILDSERSRFDEYLARTVKTVRRYLEDIAAD